jgi:hypothetical protein
MSDVYGIWEVDVIENDGKIVQHWEKKNVINYGFIGGLFKHMFGVGTDNLTLTPSTNPSRTVEVQKARFGSLYLTTYNTTDPTSSQDASLASYPTLSEEKDLTGSGVITLSSVTIDTSNEKITMTIQVTFGPTEALNGGASETWYNMIIADIQTTAKLLARVKMGSGVTKTDTQTLRIRYNFNIQVT